MRRSNPYRRPDARTRAAKAEGYPARSVFKLKEMDARLRLFRPRQLVLDLGAAPGSWSRFAGERVGPGGRVVAVDRVPIDAALGDNVDVLVGDAFELDIERLAAYGAFHVVLSDMAPATSGSKLTDQARSLELFQLALDYARRVGAPGSAFVGKLFMGPDFSAAQAAVRASFERCRTLRPAGTRRNSTEVFIVGQGLRGAPASPD
jgi:23S rRNA (uridine2552-2'-O)-methyltransferase